ncbi:MAG: sigma 54-interacting transcriptional regulator [Acidobacteriota bacterium]
MHRALTADGVQSMVNVPLMANGELIGSLNLGADRVSAFSQEDLEIAQEVADSLAVVIQHARLLQRTERHAEELEQRVAERTRELQASEDRVRSLYNHTPVMMHSIDDQGRIVDVNQFWLDKMGYQRHEVIGQPVANFAAPQSQDYVRNVMFPALMRDGSIRDVQVQGQKKNGELVDVQVSSVFRRDAHGKPLHSQAFLLDVTERNRAERARKETEERLEGMFRSAMDAIIVIDENRRMVSFNPAAEKVFGCAASEAVGQVIDQCLSEQFGMILQAAMDRPEDESAHVWLPEGVRATRKNGERFPVEATVSRTDISNARLFTIILRDVNERERAAEMLDQLQRENIYLQEEIRSEFEEIVGASPVMEQVFRNIEMVAQTDSTVLLLGETGTGKELLARAIHNRSRRKQSVMIKVNCAALPANLVESELFGHERGAFTGAVALKKGRFELAHRGTLFLDEVGELPLETQTKLLRVLQEQEFERVGGHQTHKVDVRVVAATNRSLDDEVRRGAFRSDLFYRLNVFPVEVPPLRHRRDDIPLLANYFARKFSQRMGKRIDSIHRGFHDQLLSYEWPGNVRELANLMERAVIFCQNDTLQAKHLSTIRVAAPKATAAAGPEPLPTMEEAERRLIKRALEQTDGVLAGPNGAAAILGVNRSTLWSRMRKLGIDLQKKSASATE